MGTAVIVVQGVLALAFAALNILYWVLVVGRWSERFRRRCERRYGVVITLGRRGHWEVTGSRPWYRRLGIELLQLVYFMGAFAVWAVGVLIVIAVLWSLE